MTTDAVKGCTIIVGFDDRWFNNKIKTYYGDVVWSEKIYVLGSLCVRGSVFIDNKTYETEKDVFGMKEMTMFSFFRRIHAIVDSKSYRIC